MNNKVLITGGGIVGLMTAFFLQKNGAEITLIDKGDLINETSASFGNAGLISSFEKTPLACPGVISHTLKLILQGKSPVTFNMTTNPLIMKWLWKFIKSTNKERLKKSLALFEKYGKISMNFYKETSDLLDTDFNREGLLMIYTEKNSFAAKCKEADSSDKYEIYGYSDTKKLIPFINNKVIGSVLLKRNGWLDPGKTVKEIHNYLKKQGVNFITNEKVIKYIYENNRIVAAETKNNRFKADTFVMSTGADLSLLKYLNRKFIMLPAKGYSLTFEMEESLKPSVASLFSDIFVAFTPRKTDVRFTSLMEIGTDSLFFVPGKMDKVLERFWQCCNKFEMKNIKKWTGLRPLTPNDMPLIGRDETFENLVYATGLGWMGITFGPAVGKIIADLIINNKKNTDSDDILLLSGFYQGC